MSVATSRHTTDAVYLHPDDNICVAARNLPASFVAGDFYDFVRSDDGAVTIVVADVAGKGMGASLIMASVKAVLPFVSREPLAGS